MNYERELQARLWQVLLIFAILYSVDAICTSAVACFMGKDFASMTSTEVTLSVFIICKSWATALLALVTMVIKKASSNENPLLNTTGDIRSTTTSKTETTIDQPE
jgi:hypothetical protein